MSKEPAKHKSLRVAMLAAWPLFFALLLAHAIVTGDAFPGIQILPLSLSSIFAAILLFRGRAQSVSLDPAPKEALTPFRIFIVDLSLAALHFALAIASCVIVAQGGRNWWGNTGETMLATYGTVGGLFDLTGHLFAVGAFVYPKLKGSCKIDFKFSCRKRSCNCDHCLAVTGRLPTTSAQAVGITGQRYEDLPADLEAGTGTISPKSHNSE